MIGDVADEQQVIAFRDSVLAEHGTDHINLLFNNAVYQGAGNQERMLEVTREQLLAIYQGNVSTPSAYAGFYEPATMAVEEVVRPRATGGGVPVRRTTPIRPGNPPTEPFRYGSIRFPAVPAASPSAAPGKPNAAAKACPRRRRPASNPLPRRDDHGPVDAAAHEP